MDRLFANSYMSNFNEHRYIANANVDVLCICAIYCTSVFPRKKDPSSVTLHQVTSFSLKDFLLSFS